MGKFSEDEAKVANEFFELLSGRYAQAFDGLGKYKWPGDKGKDGYWVHRYLDELEGKARPHLRAKKALVELYALRDKDGEIVRDEQGTGIRIDPKKRADFDQAFDASLEIEIPLGVKKRVFDPSTKPFLDLTPDERSVLKPYIANLADFEAAYLEDKKEEKDDE